jgi:putative zinc finger/helix-turn-helix YgiT family protein
MYENALEGSAHSCGGSFHLVAEPGTFRIHGVDVPVQHRFYRCDRCGEEQVTEDLARVVQDEAAASFRRSERFLSGAEIRALRERLGLSQEQMEAALGLGAKSLARWENDRVLQNRSMDNLLRAIDRDPTLVGHLAGLHGVPLPDGSELSRGARVDTAHWPRSLVGRLEQMAEEEGTDLQTYLIWLLTEFSIAGSFTDHMARKLDDKVSDFQRAMADRPDALSYTSEEAWKQDHVEVMRAAAQAGGYGG